MKLRIIITALLLSVCARAQQGPPAGLPNARLESAQINTIQGVNTITGSLRVNVKTINTPSYNVGQGDYLLMCDFTTNSVAILLPVASGSGREIAVKTLTGYNGNSCALTPNGSDLIDGTFSHSVPDLLSFQYQGGKLIDVGVGQWVWLW